MTDGGYYSFIIQINHLREANQTVQRIIQRTGAVNFIYAAAVSRTEVRGGMINAAAFISAESRTPFAAITDDISAHGGTVPSLPAA